MIILLIIWFLKYFLLSRFRLVFLPTTLASLPPGVMLLNHSTIPWNSTTDIEKTSRKGTPEREQPNRSVLKKSIKRFYGHHLELLHFDANLMGDIAFWSRLQNSTSFWRGKKTVLRKMHTGNRFYNEFHIRIRC